MSSLFEIFAVSVAKWKRRENLLFFLMRAVSALVRDPTVTAIIIPSECGSIQRRLCTRHKYLWVSAYFLHTWVGGYARYHRPNWMSVGANLFHSKEDSFLCQKVIYNSKTMLPRRYAHAFIMFAMARFLTQQINWCLVQLRLYNDKYIEDTNPTFS